MKIPSIKKPLSALVAGAMLISLCGCDGVNAVVNSALESAASDIASMAATEAPETTAAPQSSPDSAETSTSSEGTENTDTIGTTAPEASDRAASDYVTVGKLDTYYGAIEYPVFDTEKLDAADAKAANAFFEAVRDKIKSNVEQFFDDHEYVDDYIDRSKPLATVEYSLNIDNLSVLMSYRSYTSMDVYPYYKAINFNVDSGRAVGKNTVLNTAFREESAAEEAVYFFASDILRYEAYNGILFNCYYSGGVPGDDAIYPNIPGEQLDLALNSLKDGGEYLPDIDSAGTLWENLPIYPAVYWNENNELYIGASFATDTIGGIYNCMVAVGSNYRQSQVKNRHNPYNSVKGAILLSAQGAMEAVKSVIIEDVPELWFNVTGIDSIRDDPDDIFSDERYAYVVEAYAGEFQAENSRSLGVYGVGALDATIWRYADGGWVYVSDGVCVNDLMAAEYSNDALGVVYLAPGEYETRAINPVVEVWSTASSEYFLVGALYGGTTVTVLQGVQNADGSFSSDKFLSQIELEEGDWVMIHAPVAESDPTIAVEFATGFAKGTFAVCTSNEDIARNGKVRGVFSDEY